MPSHQPQDTLVLGRFAPLLKLAQGGMGAIYLARTEGAAGFRKPVALKLIHSHLMEDAAAVQSFIREAKIAARLVHPNIVQVLDFGEHRGRYMTVLEYVHGYSLGQLVDYLSASGRPLSVEHAVFIAYRVLRGLEFAHSLSDESGAPLGLVHRDISPQNVLISTDGQVKLTDFGVASVRSGASLSEGDALVGKLAYMAPEQVGRGRLDRRTDLFALGVVLFEVLTGRRLFEAEHEAATVMLVSQAVVPDVDALRPDLPKEIKPILAKALAKAPEDRYQDADAFATALRGVMGDRSPDDIEPGFRAFVVSVLGEVGLAGCAGALVDVEATLDRPPLSEASLGLASADPRPARRRGARWRRAGLLVPLFVLVALVVGLTVFAASWIARSSRPPAPRGQMAVIINQEQGDASAPSAASADSRPPASEASPAPRRDADQPSATLSRGSAQASNAAAPLTGRIVSRELMRRRGRFRDCFVRHAAPSVERINIFVVIEGSGAVRSASVEPASVGSTAAGRCVVDIVGATRFPRHPEATAAFRVPMRIEQD